MKYPVSRAYALNGNTYEKSYVITNINSIYIDENETITLGDKISNITLNSEILWKVQNTGEAIYSTPISTILSNGTKVLIYTSWD
jgi:hypothetical protein